MQAGGGTVSLGTSTILTANAGLTVNSGGATALTIDSGAAINIGNTNATSVSLCNSAACDTINIGNLATVDADTIILGDTLDSLTIASTGLNVTSGGALSGITTLSTSGDWTWTATTPGITINAGEVWTLGNGVATDNISFDLTNNFFRVGDATNGLTLDVDTGPVYAGTARLTKRITLMPEYAGATLTGDGTNNTGTMTSDNMTSTPFRNYYQWANTQGTAQDYDIWIKVPLPADFSAMAATPTLSIDTYSSDLTNGTVLVTVYDTSNTADCTSAAFTPTGAINTWETKTQTTCLDTGTYAADGIMTIRIKLTGAATTGVTRVNTIFFNYLAKF